jgi:hypothetical protein
MRFVPVVFVALALAVSGVARAGSPRVVSLPATDDVSLPFLCNWGYDWQERCYRDDGDRLELGGAGDKVWRSALRFSLAALPPSATVVTAELWLRYDGTCTAGLRRFRPCDGRSFGLEARPIFTTNWYARREVAFGPAIAFAGLGTWAPPQWVVLDLTDLVADWFSGGFANNGILVKLPDGQESYDVGGPAFPSSSYADPAVRPRLEVTFVSS